MFSKKLKDLASKAAADNTGFGKKIKNLVKNGPPSMEGMADAIMGKDRPEPNWNEKPFPPVIEFKSLLNGLKMKAETGEFKIETLKAYYLPEYDTEGEKLKYDPSTVLADKLLLRADLHKANDEKPLVKFYLCSSGIFKVASNIFLHNGPDNKFPKNIMLTEAGHYELKFFLANKEFYAHQFEVVKTIAEDPYAPVSAIYTIGGWWEKLAFLHYMDDNKGTECFLGFNPIFNYKGIHVKSDRNILMNNGKAQMKCVLKKGQQIIGSISAEENADKDDIFSDPHTPSFFDYPLRVEYPLQAESNMLTFLKLPMVADSINQKVKVNELSDGNYTIEMSMKDMADRPNYTAIYPFEIKAGLPIPHPLSNRKKNNEIKSLLEPGREYELIESIN